MIPPNINPIKTKNTMTYSLQNSFIMKSIELLQFRGINELQFVLLYHHDIIYFYYVSSIFKNTHKHYMRIMTTNKQQKEGVVYVCFI